MNIIQWNINGLYHNKTHLLELLRGNPANLICIQESRLKETQNFTLSGFNVIRKDCSTGLIASGGVCIIISDNLPYSTIPLQSELQVVAVRIHQPHEVTVCCIYLPPNVAFTEDQLASVITQLPRPLCILGDMNAHNPLWYSHRNDTRGRIIESFIDNYHLAVLNTDEPTHLCTATGSESHIDVSLTSATLAAHSTWRRAQDLYGSDHYPIHILLWDRQPSSSEVSRWNLKQADWAKYQEMAQLSSIDLENSDIETLNNAIKNCLLTAAETCIPKTKCERSRPVVPWWNAECERATKERKQALRRFKRHPCSIHLEEYLTIKRNCRKTLKTCQRNSWIEFLSKINCFTPIKEVWNIIKKIKGTKIKKNQITVLQTPIGLITDSIDIANHLATHFQTISSDSNYTQEFLEIKHQREATPIQITLNPLDPMNYPFSHVEFLEALRTRKDSSPGPDNICISFIKNLTSQNKFIVLKYLNKIFTTGQIPEQWKQSVGIPILKQGKQEDLATSYRMISLTCSLAKLLEKMILKRLNWFLEDRGIEPEWQSGFRQGRSTRDNLTKLGTDILNGFSRKEKTMAVFLDIKNAFDKVWRRLIIDTLIDIGIDGRILHFIIELISSRHFSIRIKSSYSTLVTQENGVQQGSVLAAKLFSLSINRVLNTVQAPAMAMLFADDFVLYASHQSIDTLYNTVQNSLNSITQWFSSRGFSISIEKSYSVLFAQRSVYNLPSLYIDDIELKYQDSFKYLGLTFDKHLNWVTHIKTIKHNCIRSMSLLRTLSNTAWGGDRKCMLLLYKSLIRSKLDYGCVAYGSASERTLSMLDPVHHSGLRIATGAFRSSPALSICAESGEPPLRFRRDQLALKYFLSIISTTAHPLTTLFNIQQHSQNINHHRPRVKSLAFPERIYKLLNDYDILYPKITKNIQSTKHPWTFPPINLNLKLTKFAKNDTNPIVYLSEVNSIMYNIGPSSIIYTDGSKTKDGVGAAFIAGNSELKFSLSPICSNYSAELLAINKALQIHIPNNNKVAILTDSLSALAALRNPFTKHPIITNILEAVYDLYRHNKSVTFVWIPGHSLIPGNENADRAAKLAITEGTPCALIPSPDFAAFLKEKVLLKWESTWRATRDNKLREIKSSTRPWKTSITGTRREEVVLARLRIGHTNLTHVYLMKKEEPPTCRTCDEQLTVKHILTDCLSYQTARQDHNIVGTLDEILRDNPNSTSNLLQFLKAANLFNII